MMFTYRVLLIRILTAFCRLVVANANYIDPVSHFNFISYLLHKTKACNGIFRVALKLGNLRLHYMIFCSSSG